jgi:hypothetical protein
MAAAADSPKRGSLLLLALCAPVGSRAPADVRLREELGGDLTRRLLRVLRARRHDRSGDLVA